MLLFATTKTFCARDDGGTETNVLRVPDWADMRELLLEELVPDELLLKELIPDELLLKELVPDELEAAPLVVNGIAGVEPEPPPEHAASAKERDAMIPRSAMRLLGKAMTRLQ